MNFCHEIQHDDLYDHLYTINVDHRPAEQQNLGHINKSQDHIEVSLPNAEIDLQITQSISSLSSSTQSSSTGFICWQTAIKFADWVISNDKCPFKTILSSSHTLELGAGTGAVLASTLGPSAKHYVSSDQKHILKLMKSNFLHNTVSKAFTSSTCENDGTVRLKKGTHCKIDFIELDWEHSEPGMLEYQALTGTRSPDVILACDTIYNEYLIPHFVSAMKRMMSENTIAIVAMQLREESILELFLSTVFDQDLRVGVVPDALLSQDLIEGFVVYCFGRKEEPSVS